MLTLGNLIGKKENPKVAVSHNHTALRSSLQYFPCQLLLTDRLRSIHWSPGRSQGNSRLHIMQDHPFHDPPVALSIFIAAGRKRLPHTRHTLHLQTASVRPQQGNLEV